MTDSIFDDFNQFLEPFLARPVATPGAAQARGRLTASEISRLAPSPREAKLNQSAENAIVPIAYGEVPVTGKLVGYVEQGSHKYYLVMWCMGPVHSVKTLFINDSTDFSGVTDLEVRHYLGTSYQPVDPWFAAYVAGYEDNLIYSKPSGKAGIVYSAIKIATAWVNTNGTPSFQAIVKGRFCYDPDKAAYTDSYFDDVGLQVEFTGADSSAPTDLDESSFARALTYVGGAAILSNKLVLDGVDNAVTIANNANFRPGTEPWSITVVCAAAVVTAGTQVIFCYGNIIAGRSSICLARSNDDLSVLISNDGSTWDVVEELIPSVFTVDVDVTVTVEFTGQSYIVLINGELVAQVISSTAANASIGTDAMELGRAGGVLHWEGTLTRIQVTFGSYRFGGSIDPLEAGTPWLDSGKYKTGYVYTDNSGLCTAELIANEFYGQGVAIADISGIQAAKDWNDELLGGSVPRGRLGLLITNPQQTQSYIDLLCTYAGLFNVPDESGYALIPDRPPTQETPSGQQMVPLHTMVLDPSEHWSMPTGWTYDSTYKVLACTNTTGFDANNDLTLAGLTVGQQYAVRLDLTWFSGLASVSVAIDGEVLATQASPGALATSSLYTSFVAAATSQVFRIIGADDVTVWISRASVRAFKWLESLIVKDSLRIKGVKDISTPTKVSVAWREATSTSANWPERTEQYTLTDALTGAIPLIETSISMPGIVRGEEAANKAQSRALRLRNRNQYYWKSLDTGLALRVGTVARIMEIEQDVMILSAKMSDYGEYDIYGETYSASHYPDALALPEDTGLVPIGAKSFLVGGSLPTDWSEWTDANGKYLVGAGFDEIGDTEGAATYAGWTGTTTGGGAHTNASVANKVPIEDYRYSSGTPGTQVQGTSENPGTHTHSYTTGTITPNPYRLDAVIVERNTTPGLKVPKEVAVFGDPNIMLPGLTRSTAWAGRVIKAAAATAAAGPAQQFITFTTGNGTIPLHDHDFPFAANTETRLNTGIQAYQGSNLSQTLHPHTHPVSIELQRNLQRLGLALFIGSEEFSVVAGMMMLWDGTQSELSDYPDWTLCDGRLGTINSTDRYFEIAGIGDENRLAGNNTIAISGQVSFDAGHTHLSGGATLNFVQAVTYVAHDVWAHKDHNISESATWQPPSQKVGLIVFNPRPAWGFVDLRLLLGGGGTDGSGIIIDSAPGATTPDVSEDVVYDDAQSFFAATSLYINSGPRDGGLDYDGILSDLLNGRYTIAAWVRTSTIASDQFLFSTGKGVTTEDYWDLRIDTNGDLEFLYNNTIEIQGSAEIAAGTDTFVAVTWDGEEFRVYSGTVASDTAARVGTFTPSAPVLNDNLTIFNNADKTASFTGWAEDIYIIDGAAEFRETVESIPNQPPRP